MGSAAPDHARRAATSLRPGDRTGADAEARPPSRPATSRSLQHHVARARADRARPYHPVPTRPQLRRPPASGQATRRIHPHGAGQHGAAGVRPGRMGRGEARACRRQWRRPQLAVEAATGEIAAHGLTGGHADDAAQAPDLLRQVEGRIASVTADGACDGGLVYRAVAARQHDPLPDTHTSRRARLRCQARTKSDCRPGMTGTSG